MILLGFRAQNHPQQTLPAGPNDDVDDRATTRCQPKRSRTYRAARIASTVNCE